MKIFATKESSRKIRLKVEVLIIYLGEITWSTGLHYSGSFKDGRMHGHGQFYWPHIKFSGTYVESRKQGPGVFTYSDGSTLNCSFDSDILVETFYVEWPL